MISTKSRLTGMYTQWAMVTRKIAVTYKHGMTLCSNAGCETLPVPTKADIPAFSELLLQFCPL